MAFSFSMASSYFSSLYSFLASSMGFAPMHRIEMMIILNVSNMRFMIVVYSAVLIPLYGHIYYKGNAFFRNCKKKIVNLRS